MYWILLSVMLFLKEEWRWCLNLRNLEAWIPSICICRNLMLSIFVYQILNKTLCNKRRSFCWKLNIKNNLLLSSITTHSQKKPSPTLIYVSLIMNSDTSGCLYDILSGLYFWTHFHVETWLNFTNLKMLLLY